MEENNILNKLNNISDIKKLNENELEILSKDIRKLLVRTTALTGGHLSSSLGVVELTIALFKNFDLSKDKVVWDVGHQAYAHKILSGRRESFSTLRQKDGICGFPKQSESPYDA
ncbi:MAG: 1-deoxy-D-xylulose-5-phosphate synthase N-terminal domain-containing protein, partial [Clostridia bacterium]